jgi:hypothetical protein
LACAFSCVHGDLVHLATCGWGFGFLAFSFKQNQPAAFKMPLAFALLPCFLQVRFVKKKTQY